MHEFADISMSLYNASAEPDPQDKACFTAIRLFKV